jgi:acyl carrier protein
MKESQKLYNYIKKTLSNISGLPADKISDDDDFQEKLDIDSLEAIEVLHKIEKKYKVKIQNVELEDVQTLKKIYEVSIRSLGIK